MEDTNVTVKIAGKLGLLPEEFERIKEILGRTPNFTELSIFSVMWSEHCSFKNSISWLRTLPRESLYVLVDKGQEEVGLVNLGDGLACCFKIESHNHPSAVKPYQGAASGIGGINRDIFTKGARPIAQLNSLRFGDLDNERTKWLLKGITKGIGDYGNAFGVPVVGGEIYFEECYQTNPLVNVMSVGIVKIGETVPARAAGVGNTVYIVGAATGKDGIIGTDDASDDYLGKEIEKLATVHIGDPFQQKLLLEATLEVIASGAVVGMQDLSAAGIARATSEMAAAGKHGMSIYLDKVPLRQKNMAPWEILLSESHDRMLVVIEKGRESEVEAIYEKWDLNSAIIGVVTGEELLKFYWKEELVAQTPAVPLVLGGGAPVYNREFQEPAYYALSKTFNMNFIEIPEDLKNVAKILVSHPNIASKRWVYQQYDSMVQTSNMTTNMPSDASIVNIKGTERALVMTVDCNARYVYADPEIGSQIAVSEAARNIVCAGGLPSAVTNCLNFGNPYNPEVYWQFVGAIKGMGKACERFKTPVTGGNVSFYNQTTIGKEVIPVYPTPTIGMVGILEDKAYQMTMDFKKKGDVVFLIGKNVEDISSSQYLNTFHQVKLSPPPYFNLDEEVELHECMKALIRGGYISSAHDICDGGLFISLIESAMVRNLGFAIEMDADMRPDAFLFGEAQGRVVVSVDSDREVAFVEFMKKTSVPLLQLGHITKGELRIDGVSFGYIKEYKQVYHNTITDIMKDETEMYFEEEYE